MVIDMVQVPIGREADIMSDSRGNNEDILRVMGFIGFVSLLVGAAIAVFDANLWLRSEDTYSNAMTYAMGAFTLQGMSFFFYKLLLQEGMDTKASWTRTQRMRDRRLQDIQSQFANAQLESELKVRQHQMDRQLSMLEQNPDGYMAMMGGNNLGILDDQYRGFDDSTAGFNPPPTHKIDEQQPVNLGVDYGKKAEEEEEESPVKKDGSPDKRYKKKDEQGDDWGKPVWQLGRVQSLSEQPSGVKRYTIIGSHDASVSMVLHKWVRPHLTDL